MSNFRIFLITVIMSFSLNGQAENLLTVASCGSAVSLAAISYFETKPLNELNSRRNSFLEKLKNQKMPKGRAYRVFMLLNKLTNNLRLRKLQAYSHRVYTGIFAAVCAVAAKSAEASSILDDPIYAIENNEDFRNLVNIVGADQAIIIMERIADGENPEKVLDSVMPEIKRFIDYSSEK
ncbi:MAG: hypothetical protein MK008_04160 [Bdellovibrionales bacterium]|nr:hypothetical protein [Bdellovibrionales bacterium]